MQFRAETTITQSCHMQVVSKLAAVARQSVSHDKDDRLGLIYSIGLHQGEGIPALTPIKILKRLTGAYAC